MPGDSLDLRNRVAADLTSRAGTFLITGWTAETPFAPTYELKSLSTIKVAVCPASRTLERTNKTLRSRTLGVWIGILKRLTDGNGAAGDLTETATLIDFVEQLSDLFLPPAGGHYILDGRYRALEITNDPLYDVQKLRENREFRSALLVTFRIDQ